MARPVLYLQCGLRIYSVDWNCRQRYFFIVASSIVSFVLKTTVGIRIDEEDEGNIKLFMLICGRGPECFLRAFFFAFGWLYKVSKRDNN